MTRTAFLKNNLPYILLVFLCIILSIFFLPESLERTLVVLLLLIGSLILLFYTKNSILSSALFLLFVLPLNVTFQLPESVSIFGTELILSNPYVNGVYVNYLVPTIALTDLALLLFCFASFTSGRKILIKNRKARRRYPPRRFGCGKVPYALRNSCPPSSTKLEPCIPLTT